MYIIINKVIEGTIRLIKYQIKFFFRESPMVRFTFDIYFYPVCFSNEVWFQSLIQALINMSYMDCF